MQSLPEMARNIFFRGPNALTPTSFRSSSVIVKNVFISICKTEFMADCFSNSLLFYLLLVRERYQRILTIPVWSTTLQHRHHQKSLFRYCLEQNQNN